MTDIESLLENNSRQEISWQAYRKNRGIETYSEDEGSLSVHIYSPHVLQRVADTLSPRSKPDYMVRFEDGEENRYFAYNHEELTEVEEALEDSIEEESRITPKIS